MATQGNVAQISEHLDCSEPHTEDKGSGPAWLCLNCSDGGLGFLNIFPITAKSFSVALGFLLATTLLSQVFVLGSCGRAALCSSAVFLATFGRSLEFQLGLDPAIIKG